LLFTERQFFEFALFAYEIDPDVQIGFFQIDNETPLQPGLQSRIQKLQTGDLFRTAKDHLLAVVVKVVEQQDDLLLQLLAPTQHLQIVH
jgi:predicted nucleic acid-binding OB-fold protein